MSDNTELHFYSWIFSMILSESLSKAIKSKHFKLYNPFLLFNLSMRVHIPNIDPVDFSKSPTVSELVEKTYPKKSSQVVGAVINDSAEVFDVRTLLKDGDTVQPVFIPSEEALEVIRHSAAHVMAQAVQELWPDIRVTIGPVIENGFYYDFDSNKPFHPEDLEKIESKMKEINQKEIWRSPKKYGPKTKPFLFLKI